MNGTVERWREAGESAPGDRPDEDGTVATTEAGDPIERYAEALATSDVAGEFDAMALFAGQSAGLADEVSPAASVVGDLVDETEAAIDPSLASGVELPTIRELAAGGRRYGAGRRTLF